MFLRLLALAGAAVELAEAEVAVRDEGDLREPDDRSFSNGTSGLFLRRHSPQIGDDRIEILLAHARIPGEAHRRQQLATILADALRDGAAACDALILLQRDHSFWRHASRVTRKTS